MTAGQEENGSLQAGNEAKPPWGLSDDIKSRDGSRSCTAKPQTAPGMKYPWTVYQYDFQKQPPASPAVLQRTSTAEHFLGDWPFERTHYSSTFRTPDKFSRHMVNPASKHRYHKPHLPDLKDPWHFPDRRYLIWQAPVNPPDRKISSAPTMLQMNRHFWGTTTYKQCYQGNQLNLPNLQSKSALALRKGPTPAIKTQYMYDYKGARGKPSTTERPYGNSWRNTGL